MSEFSVTVTPNFAATKFQWELVRTSGEMRNARVGRGVADTEELALADAAEFAETQWDVESATSHSIEVGDVRRGPR